MHIYTYRHSNQLISSQFDSSMNDRIDGWHYTFVSIRFSSNLLAILSASLAGHPRSAVSPPATGERSNPIHFHSMEFWSIEFHSTQCNLGELMKNA